MAIRPAPMDQCQVKTKCQTGPNRGLAYDEVQPCETGFSFVEPLCDCYQVQCGVMCSEAQTVTLTSTLSLRTRGVTVYTYLPAPNLEAGTAMRVVEGTVEFYNGCTGQFEFFATSPYPEGSEYEDEIISFATEKAELSYCPDFDPVEEPDPNPIDEGDVGIEASVAEFNGSNFYHFVLVQTEAGDGVAQRTPVILHSGQNELIINQGDPSNAGHPMALYLDEARTQLIVQTRAEGSLGVDRLLTLDTTVLGLTAGTRIYYGCAIHDGMGGDGYIELI